MVTLVIAGEESPDYGVAGLSERPRRRQAAVAVGRPLADRGQADRAWPRIETELTALGTQVEVTMPDGRLVTALVDTFPIYDPEKTRPRS